MSSKDAKWVICTGPDWFRPSVTSTRQIIFKFIEDDYSVLWVNPIAFKSPAVNSDTKKSMQRKIINKLKTHLKLFRKVDSKTYVLVPLYIPVFNSFYDKLNDRLIKLQLRVASILLGLNWRESILWISGNFTLSPLLRYRFKSKIYQAADLISDFRTDNKMLLERLKQKEIYLGNNVDHIFASSPNIQQKLKKLTGRNIHLLTHGVNLEHFTKKHELSDFIKNVRSKGLPIAGYFGTLSDANDKEALKALADNGFSVVLIGKVLGDYTILDDHHNVYFAGPVDFKDLPSYAQGFDVCLLNWIMADWIKNSFPVKSIEYLAMGKPVVSCRIPVIEELFSDYVYFADTPSEFVEQAVLALKENSEQKQKERVEEASQHTWTKKFELIKSIIQ